MSPPGTSSGTRGGGVPLWICGLAVTAAVMGAAGWLQPAQAAVLSYGVIAGILALSLNILMGHAGQISLAQASFLGVGSFVTGFVVSHAGATSPWSLLMSLGASVAFSAAVAVVVGLPAIRLRGIYLAIATFAFADAFDNYIFNIQKLTGLGSGVTVPRPRLGPLHLKADTSLLAFALLWLAVAWYLDTRLVATRHGRALLAVRESEEVAASFGVPVAREKLRAFLLCGGLAGLAGCLYAYQVQVVVKSSYALQVSLLYLIIVVVGGLGSRTGVVVAAVFFTLLPYWFAFLKGWDIIVAPALLVYTVVTNPGGLPDHLRRAREKRELERRRLTGEELAALLPARTNGGSVQRARARARRGPALLRIEGVSVHFGGVKALDDVDLEVAEGEAVGLIGPNGAGKSTLFNVISGFERLQSGRVVLAGTDLTNRPPHDRAALGLGRTFQHIGLVRKATLVDNLLLAQHVRLGYGAVAGLAGLPAALRVEAAARDEAMALLRDIGLAAYADLRVEVLSTGQQRLLELACAIAARPRLVLLDEPSAGMSPAAAEYLAQQLTRLRETYDTALLLIEHHIPLVTAVCERTYVLDAGRVIAEGDVRRVIRSREVVAAYVGQAG